MKLLNGLTAVKKYKDYPKKSAPRTTRLMVLFLLNWTILSAQSPSTGSWFAYSGNHAFNKHWNWWNDIQHRNHGIGSDFEQFIFRTGIGYNLTENNNNLLLGYARILSDLYQGSSQVKTHSSEHRIFQQLITRQNWGRVFLQHRYRLEERFFTNDFRVRFRYSLSMNIPFNKPLITKHAVYLAASNEIFLHLNSPVFDRDRIYTGIGYALSNTLRVESGIMYQLLETRNKKQLQFNIINTIPFSRKK